MMTPKHEKQSETVMPTAQLAKTIAPGTRLKRVMTFARDTADAESRTVELSFSSEEPYERWWGVEILDHSAPSVRLGRLKDGGALLVDHDARDHVGVIESVTLTGRRGLAKVRFGKSARAEEVFQDVLDGIRRNVSVGYIIHKAVMEEVDGDPNDGPVTEKFRVTDWEPLEVSLVAVPADPSVGVGRSVSSEKSPLIEVRTSEPAELPKPQIQVMPEVKTMSDIDIQKTKDEAAAEERKRISAIHDMASAFKRYGADEKVAEAISGGASVDQFRATIMELVSRAPKPKADIGLTEKEAKSFSFIRALNALANPTERRIQEAAAFERECSDAVSAKLGRSAQGLLVPIDVQQQRDLAVGTPTAGGHLVATNLLAQNFIELLRNRMATAGLGATVLSGLVGDIAIPKQTGGATAYWVAESGGPTESQQVVGQVAMSPKTVGAFTDISRKLLLQSSISVENFVRVDLATVIALALDMAAINGLGASNQPRGILQQSGIGAVVGGANGAAPTWDHIVDLETAVSVANADVGSLAYLTNAKVRGKLKKTFVDAGSGERVWERGEQPLNGYNAVVSNQVPATLTKGTATAICSAILFGNWVDLVIGQWGTLDLTVDPYTNSTSGTVRVVALQDADVAVRNVGSFAAMVDALT